MKEHLFPPMDDPCDVCGEVAVYLTGSRRYKQDGEWRIEITWRCENCGHVEVIDAKIADPAPDRGEGQP